MRAANKNDSFTEHGNPGFDHDVFKALAARDARRARQVAEGLDGRRQTVVALAGVYRQRAEALGHGAKGQ